MNNINQNGAGFIYVLTNDAMPGYIKIGKTGTSVEQRVIELSRSTSVPLPFECYYAARVEDMDKVERALHDAFGDHRKNPRREFFTLSPERVVAILSLLSIEEVTPSQDVGVETKEDATAVEIARKKRSAFNFKMVNIDPGTVLKFIRDESVSCVVATDQKHVIFQDKEMSLSSAAQIALGYKKQVQGPAYWTLDGEILDELRSRIELEEDQEIEAAGDWYIQNQMDIARGK